MTREDAMNQGIAYAYGREDVSGVTTVATKDDPAGCFAFATAYAQGWDEYNQARRGSMTNLRSAYDRWQASPEGRPSIWGPHDSPAKPREQAGRWL